MRSRTKAGLIAPGVALLLAGLIVPFARLAVDAWVSAGTVHGALSWHAILVIQNRTMALAMEVATATAGIATLLVLAIRSLPRVLQRIALFVCILPLVTHIAFRVFGVQLLIVESRILAGILFTRTAVILGLMHWTLPTAIMIMFAAAIALPPDVFDAAAFLGAPRTAILVRITIPLLLPSILLTWSLAFCGAYGAFIVPSALGGVDEVTVSRVIGELLREGHSDASTILALIALMIPFLVFAAAGLLHLRLQRDKRASATTRLR